MSNLTKAIIYIKQNGLLDFLFAVKARIFGGHNPLAKKSTLKTYGDLFEKPFGFPIEPKAVNSNTINWFIPPFGKGSGGHLNIFRFIKNLEHLGIENRIIVVGSYGTSLPSAKHLKANIKRWFFPLKAEVYEGIGQHIPSAYFAIATSWPTAYYLNRFLGCIRKCYFVQDFEPLFYASGTESTLAENTYKFGFYGITAGEWLAHKLNAEYGMKTSSVGFSFDKDIYKPLPELKKNDGIKRVFFYARPPTPRRAFELGMLILNELCKDRPDIEVMFAGWDLSNYKIPFRHKSAGILSLNKLPEFYSQCDAALVLSFSNVSLLPLELMACKVPVVSNRAPSTEWLLNDKNCLMVEPDIWTMKQAIIKVLDDNQFATKLKDSAQLFANKTSWEVEAEKFKNILTSYKI